MKWSGSGRPSCRHRVLCALQNKCLAFSVHRSQNGSRHSVRGRDSGGGACAAQGGRVGPPGPLPGAAMAQAQARSAGSIPAPCDRAAGELAAPVQRRAGISEEVGHAGAASGAPALAVGAAQSMLASGPVAAFHQACPPAQHRVFGVWDEHLGAELRAHRGEQLLQ